MKQTRLSFEFDIVWKLVLLVILLILLVLGNVKWAGTKYLKFKEFTPRYPISEYPPKVLMYSAMTPEYLKTTAGFWHKEVGIDGFVITTLPSNWYDRPAELKKYFHLAKSTNSICRRNGITKNFLKIALGHGALPDYFDDPAWKPVLEQIRQVALFARETGFVGIALDTESYSGLLWNPAKMPLAKYPLEEAKAKIRQRGREIMQEMAGPFPQAEFFVFPEGHLYSYKEKKHSKYELWMDFFNGLISAENEKGVILGCERTYKVTGKNKLIHYYYDEIQGPIMGENVSDPNFWYTKCTIALGAWPLGRTYADKRAWYSTLFFERQWNAIQMTCPKYVWIYAHGSAWWQAADPAKYRLHPEAAVPTVKNIEKYYKIVRQNKDPALRKYFYAVKYGRLPSLLEVILGNLGF